MAPALPILSACHPVKDLVEGADAGWGPRESLQCELMSRGIEECKGMMGMKDMENA